MISVLKKHISQRQSLYCLKSILILSFCLIISFKHQAQFTQKWEFKTGGAIFSSPLVDSDKIYVGSADHKIYCLQLNTGKKLWEFETRGEVHSSPKVMAKLLLFGSGDGNLYAIDKDTGEEQWKFNSEGEKSNGLWDYYLSSPAGDGDIIFWGSGDGNLYAIEPEAGKLIWKFKTQGIIHADPVISGNKVFIGSFDGHLYALNKLNGELLWKFKTLGAQYFPKGEIQKAVLVDQGTVYFGSRDYNLYALDENTGSVKWNMREPSGWIIATPVASDDHIFFGTSDAHRFYCFNKQSGAKVWELPLRMRVFGSAVIGKQSIYFGTFDGKLVAADIKTGMISWEFQTNGSRKNYPTVFNENGEFKEGFSLYGKDIIETERKIIDLGAILSTPVIAQKTIYFGSSDGTLYAISL